jgi:arylsulfatase A-like enzyme
MKVLVVVAEALPAAYVGCYGNEWIETPNLDGIAAAGVVFDQHFADCPEPTAARRSWRTGRYQLPEFDGADPPPAPAAADLIAGLRAAGVATCLALTPDRPWAAAFADGWEHVEPIAGAGEGTLLERSLEAGLNGLDWLAGRDRWLLWLELPTLVPPWEVPAEFRDRYLEPADDDEEPPEPWTDPVDGFLAEDDDRSFRRLQAPFAAAVTYLDTGLGLFLDELEKRGLADDVWVIVTSDRGLALGEHGLLGDGRPWLHEERLHVPLLVLPPDPAQAGGRVPALTQPVDLAPTLRELYGVPGPAVHGASLLPLLADEGPAVREYAVAGQRQGAALEFALRTPRWGLVLPVRSEPGDRPRLPQLFVKPDDRWEVNDVRQHHLDWAEQLELLLREFVTATRQPGPLRPPGLPAEDGGR